MYFIACLAGMRESARFHGILCAECVPICVGTRANIASVSKGEIRTATRSCVESYESPNAACKIRVFLEIPLWSLIEKRVNSMTKQEIFYLKVMTWMAYNYEFQIYF